MRYIDLLLGLLFNVISGFLASVFYKNLHVYLMKKMEKGFTFGEASVAAQAITLLLYTTIINVMKSVHKPPIKNMEISIVIIQVSWINMFLKD